jgi:hypothetical protein
VLPKELVKLVPKTHLMSEAEWRSIGIQQSQGWVHYMNHQPGEKTQMLLPYCITLFLLSHCFFLYLHYFLETRQPNQVCFIERILSYFRISSRYLNGRTLETS